VYNGRFLISGYDEVLPIRYAMIARRPNPNATLRR
jgi:hypothetical protein